MKKKALFTTYPKRYYKWEVDIYLWFCENGFPDARHQTNGCCVNFENEQQCNDCFMLLKVDFPDYQIKRTFI